MGLSISLEPGIEPVSVEDMLDHARIIDANDAGYIASCIAVARRAAERHTRRQLVTATWKLTLDRFPVAYPCAIHLPRPPLQSVTSIKYIDGGGVERTVLSTAYEKDVDCEPGRVYPIYGTCWPMARLQPNAVTILYKAGYGGLAPTDVQSAAAVPMEIKHAIKMIAAHLYEIRQSVLEDTDLKEVPQGAVMLLDGAFYGSYTE